MKKQSSFSFLLSMLKGLLIGLVLVGILMIIREYLADLSTKYDQTNNNIYIIIAVVIIVISWNLYFPI